MRLNKKDVVAERSKALDLGSSLFGGAGSNPADIILSLAEMAQLGER